MAVSSGSAQCRALSLVNNWHMNSNNKQNYRPNGFISGQSINDTINTNISPHKFLSGVTRQFLSPIVEAVTQNTDSIVNDLKSTPDKIDPSTLQTPVTNEKRPQTGDNEVEKQPVTQFIDDTTVIQHSLQNDSKPYIIDHSESDIISNLERPTIVHEGTFSSSDVAIPLDSIDTTYTSRLLDLQFPRDLINANPAIKRKLQDYALLRADISLRIKINSHRYQVGRYWLMFSPFQEVVDSGQLQSKAYAAGITGFPGFWLDIGSQNSMSIEIPYCSYLQAYDLQNAVGQFGHFEIWCISPLASFTETETAASYTIFANFKNISLSAVNPNTTDLTSFSHSHGVLEKAQPRKESIRSQAQRKLDSMTDVECISTGFVSQGLFNKEAIDSTHNIVAEATAPMQNYPFSNRTDRPRLQKFGKALGWMGRIAKGAMGVGKLFGFSEPENLLPTQPISWKPASNMQHFEGVDDSTILAAIPDNSLGDMNGLFATDEDEMSINWIASRPTVASKIAWSNTGTAGTTLTELPVSPIYPKTLHTDYSTILLPTLLAYLSVPFHAWRGSLNYKISVVKNAMVSGCLRIYFIPFSSKNSTTHPSNAKSIVLDLSESDEIIVSVPYISPYPWTAISVGTADITNPSFATGTLVIEIQNPLVVPGEILSAVDVIVEISGGSDFELAMPGVSPFVNSIPDIPLVPLTLPELDPEFQAEALGRDPTQAVVPLFETSDDSFKSRMNCIGELVINLRAFIHRFSPYHVIDFSTDQKFSFQTLLHPEGSNLSGTLSLFGNRPDFSPNSYSALSYFANIFRFWRGSERIKIFPVGHGTTTSHAVITYNQSQIGAPFAIQPLIGCQPVEFTKPFYNIADKRVTYWSQQDYRDVDIVFNGLNSGLGYVFGSAGDDFSFGWLIGPSPLVMTTFVEPTPYAPATGSGQEVTITNTPLPVDISSGAGTVSTNVTAWTVETPLDVNVTNTSIPVDLTTSSTVSTNVVAWSVTEAVDANIESIVPVSTNATVLDQPISVTQVNF